MTEIRRFLIALGYFTRIPIPAWVGWAPEELNRAARYFPAVGLVVGGASALMLWACSLLWAPPVAIVLAMLCGLLLTGAFHEDGLADSADGFGGGYARERVLEIMKDSRIGSFGAVALTVVMLAKFSLLWTLGTQAVLALLLAHPLSRAAALCLMGGMPYVRETDDARAKPVAQGLGYMELLVGVGSALLLIAIAVAFNALSIPRALATVCACALAALLCARYCMRRIGGYTGDCLGATQQICELAAYLALAARIH